MSNHNEDKIPVLSFYSGGGFLDMGFEQAGFNIVWTNEYDHTFAELHSAGITSWRQSRGIETVAEIFNTKSIIDISYEEIVQQAFPEGIPKYFGIIGGPPCQDFSINGGLKGFDGERGKLTILFFKKILELNPTFFVIENVAGLVNRVENKKHLDLLLKTVENNYFIDWEVLNSLDFGVPQFRERVFIVGFSKQALEKKSTLPRFSKKWFPFPANLQYKNSAKKYNWGKEVEFGTELSIPENLPIELCVENCLVSNNDIDSIANANEYFNLRVSINKLSLINEGETNRPSFKRLHRFKYSPTACYGNNEVHLHPYHHRRLSVRETLRIQGVSDNYILPPTVSLTKKFKMIGNGVPVPLAKAVADSLRVFIETEEIIQFRKLQYIS